MASSGNVVEETATLIVMKPGSGQTSGGFLKVSTWPVILPKLLAPSNGSYVPPLIRVAVNWASPHSASAFVLYSPMST